MRKPCTTCRCGLSAHAAKRFAQKNAMYFECTKCARICHEFGREVLFVNDRSTDAVWQKLNEATDHLAEFAAAPRDNTKRITCDNHRDRTKPCVCMW